jgi:hypothetical protein
MGILRVALEPVERVKQRRPEFTKLRVQITPKNHGRLGLIGKLLLDP